jgi:hypothetical protein
LSWGIRLDSGGVRDVTGFAKTTAKNESQMQIDIAVESREQMALLKINEHKARRQGLKTEKEISKAPDWTDDEIQVLRNGIIGRRTAKNLLPLLPRRTTTSIKY